MMVNVLIVLACIAAVVNVTAACVAWLRWRQARALDARRDALAMRHGK